MLEKGLLPRRPRRVNTKDFLKYDITIRNMYYGQCDDSYELFKSLKGKGRVKQYAVTNGTKAAQDKKLNKSGLIDIWDDVFISEVVGTEKPGIEFFEYVWEQIGNYEKDEVMIVGDSLTSDMQGGNNAGIICCWYNSKKLTNDKGLVIDYEIDNL